jgi:hypothetical protein
MPVRIAEQDMIDSDEEDLFKDKPPMEREERRPQENLLASPVPKSEEEKALDALKSLEEVSQEEEKKEEEKGSGDKSPAGFGAEPHSF